jgi:TRAP-type C4-dicarboxylate transport system permease small subunit
MADTMNPEDRLAGPQVGRIARVLALIGGAMLLLISGFVTVSVVLRAITGGGINGDFEVVQLAAALAAFCLFPLCISIRGNIFVETFTSNLPKRVTAFIDGLWDTLFGLICVVLAWRMVIGTFDQLASKTTTMVLAIPIWWVVGICAALIGLLAMTCLVVGYRMIRGRT